MRKSIVRLFSLMLCFISLLSLLPVTAIAAATPGKPTNLEWNKLYCPDENGKMVSVAQNGYISFHAEAPYGDTATWFEIKFYKNDKQTYETSFGLDNDYLRENDGYVSIDTSLYLDNVSGVYHFTVKAMSDSVGTSCSALATSPDWNYTPPSRKVSAPANVRIEWPYVKWDHNNESAPMYEVELYYSSKKNVKSSLFAAYTTPENESYIPPYLGTGYYTVRVRSLSEDVYTAAHSSWAEPDSYYFTFEGPQVKVSNISSSGKVEISWSHPDNNTSKYIKEYEIYRATSKDGEYKKLATSFITSYTDKSVAVGKKYYYQVRAVTIFEKISQYSSTVSIYGKLPQPEIKGTNSTSSGKPKISWDEVSGAVKYELFRATSKNGSYEKIKSTTGTSYTDHSANAGTKYYYKVTAIHSNASVNSACSEPLPKYCDLPQLEVNTSNSSSTGKVKVSWKAIDGAAGYTVYRASSKDGSYKELDITTSTSFTDSSATVGKKYYYKVKALHENTSANSAKSKAVSDIRKLAQPEVQTSNSSSSGKVKISWDELSGAEQYYVYRATSKDGEYEQIASTTGGSYTDSSAKTGKKYYYKVKAFHEKEAANSAKSDAASDTRKLPRPDVTITLKSGDPKLSWDKISGAEKYYIYRATSKSGEYEKIKETTSTSFTDKKAKAGKKYYYKVKAVHSKSGGNSAYSSVDSIKAQ